jgi:hypothetical protein
LLSSLKCRDRERPGDDSQRGRVRGTTSPESFKRGGMEGFNKPFKLFSAYTLQAINATVAKVVESNSMVR